MGWALNDNMHTRLVISALETAKGRGYVAENAVFHIDRGSRYTSKSFAGWTEVNDVRLSCSRTGNCHDDAVAESFSLR